MQPPCVTDDQPELLSRLTLVADAAAQVRASDGLVEFFEACLRLGNTMNKGTNYGNARGEGQAAHALPRFRVSCTRTRPAPARRAGFSVSSLQRHVTAM